MSRIFISDCEGPISKNDNAYEIASHFIPDGNKLFNVISRYDDVLSDVLGREGHKAGDTLKLILPFLKAYDATDQEMRKYSAGHLLLIPGAKETMVHLRSIAPTFIVSTSYEFYVLELCRAIGFPYGDTYCTKVSIDKYRMANGDRKYLRETAKEIMQMNAVQIPMGAESMDDFSEEDQNMIQRLDGVFWEEMPSMECGRMLSEVNVVGGREKVEAIMDTVRRSQVDLSDVMYVGDSITDEEAFRLLRKKGGLTVSFNGNQYAIRSAEVAILSRDSMVTEIIAEAFIKSGRRQTLDLIENWSYQALKRSFLAGSLLDRFLSLNPTRLPKVRIITDENMDNLTEESIEFRKKVRGEAIGALG